MQIGREILYLKLDSIIPNRYQPRINFDEESLKELAISIKNYGIIEPLIVRQLSDKYEIVAGERRYKAAAMAGLTEVPVILVSIDDQISAELALVETLERKDLSPIEEAKGYEKILSMGNLTQEQLANKTGKSKETISNKMKLLTLTKEVQEALMNNEISERHAKSLLNLNDTNKQIEVLNKIISERLNVKKTDEYITSLKESSSVNLNNNTLNNINRQISVSNNQDIVNLNDLNNPNMELPNIITNIKEEKKEEINMNQEQNNTVDFNSNIETTQVNQPAPRFFPSIENETVNMNFEQPMVDNTITNQNQVPIANETIPSFEPVVPTPIPTLEPTQVKPQTSNESISPITQPTPEVISNVVNNNPEVIDIASPSSSVQFANQQIFNEPPMMPNITSVLQPTSPIESQFNNSMPEIKESPIIPNIYPEVVEQNSMPTIGPNPVKNMNMPISTIRGAISTVEANGYVVNVEEMDLEGEYQIVIKIQK